MERPKTAAESSSGVGNRRHPAMLALLALTLAPVGTLADDSKPAPPSITKGWAEVVDPDGDCKVTGESDHLTVEVPGTKHDLSAETNEVNSPRVLKNVEGDFLIQVKVGQIRHNGQRTSDRSQPYHGAGLLIWVDGGNYVRLERACLVQADGTTVSYANFEIRRDGTLKEGDSTAFQIPDRDTYLRLERRGGRVHGLVSPDGVNWGAFKPYEAELPKSVKVGVAAVNTSTAPLKAEFSEVEVFRKEPN